MTPSAYSLPPQKKTSVPLPHTAQGYSTEFDTRLRRTDAAKLASLRAECGSEASPSDVLAVLDVTGPGVPGPSRWFWASRDVHAALEPCWLKVFSAGVLGPRVVALDTALSPG